MTPLRAVVEVEHRREAEVDAAGAQLGGEHVAGGGGRLEARASRRAAAPRPSSIHSSPRTRIAGSAVKPSLRKRCTRPPSWSTQTSRSGRSALISAIELGELPPVAPVAREQDHAAGERMREAAPVVGVEREAGDVEHHRRWVASFIVRSSCVSTTTKLAA